MRISPHKPHGNGSSALSCSGNKLDGSHVPFGLTAAHNPAGSLTLRVRRKPLDKTMKNKMIGMNIKGQAIINHVTVITEGIATYLSLYPAHRTT